MNLYITADEIGVTTGGGLVTYHESEALKSLGECEIWSKKELNGGYPPFHWDDLLFSKISHYSREKPTLVHGYAGSFSRTVDHLKKIGTKVVWTVAAHDVELSRREHLAMGLPFDFPHLNDPTQFQRYIAGYKAADVIVAPGKAPMGTMRRQGITNRIEIIPHGCTLPEKVSSLCKPFRIGYLGSFGSDKGVRYLIEAWGKLNYNDATLVLGGKDSTHPWVVENLIKRFGGNSKIISIGWVDNVSDFYNSISCYIQPSATEGFGIEVIEAMAHQRPVLCSDGAGAADLLPVSWRFPACDSEALAEKIDFFRSASHLHSTIALWNRKQAEKNTWDIIRERYKKLWQEVLSA